MAREPGNGWCERLYQEQAAALLLYGRALGLSHAEAEDVVQETFIALLHLAAEPVQPGHYLLRAFRNRALNHRRSLWRRVAREFEAARWFERGPDETPAERAAMRCLARLPAEQREVIVLKLWHGHTFEAVGELLGISPNTAAGRYRYGLEKLRACLNRENSYERTEPESDSTGSAGEPLAFLDAPRAVGGA
jgi:RNA polymerase sigma-70 factor (ECF subfamily)